MRATRLGLVPVLVFVAACSSGSSDCGDWWADLNTALGADAVVVGYVASTDNTYVLPSGTRVLAATIEINQVLFVAASPEQRVTYPDYPDLPSLEARPLIVYEALGCEPPSATSLSRLGDRQAVFVLTYIHPGWEAAWSVGTAAAIESDGSLTFLGTYRVDADQEFEPVVAEYATLHPATPTSDLPVAALAAWVEEKAALRSDPQLPPSETPLQHAFDDSVSAGRASTTAP